MNRGAEGGTERTQVAVNHASEMRTTRFRDTMSTGPSERSEVVDLRNATWARGELESESELDIEEFRQLIYGGQVGYLWPWPSGHRTSISAKAHRLKARIGVLFGELRSKECATRTQSKEPERDGFWYLGIDKHQRIGFIHCFCGRASGRDTMGEIGISYSAFHFDRPFCIGYSPKTLFTF